MKKPDDAILTVSLATIPYEFLYQVDWEVSEALETLYAIRSSAKRT